MIENWTPLGIAGAVLGILFFIVRYFVKTLESKDNLNRELTNKFIQIAQENTEARIKLTQAIDTNTLTTRNTADSLTKLVMEVIKTK